MCNEPEDIRRIALEGLELPARARVLSSEATSQRYVATVEVLDGAGEPTGQMLEESSDRPALAGRGRTGRVRAAGPGPARGGRVDGWGRPGSQWWCRAGWLIPRRHGSR